MPPVVESSSRGDRRNPKNFPFFKKIPEGDNRERMICGDCGWIHYVNPKVVVGAVVGHEGRLLLCRRAIEPRRGFWTIPAGYLEERETPEAAASREALEEACAEIAIEQLLAVYSILRISQVQLIYRATLAQPSFAPGPESLEVRLYDWDGIPWGELAFPSVHWALRQYREVTGRPAFPAFSNPPNETGEY